MNESVINFDCHGDRLIGILHQPLGAQNKIGVVIVVGGPQYRVGSHRQFTIMARAFAAAGYPTLRFDYRGMGDSEGEYLGFRSIDRDISAAVDAIKRETPEIDGVVLWGLCDAASACLIYGGTKKEFVLGKILVNPWIEGATSRAKAYVKHYYIKRIYQKSFWSKLFSASIRIDRALFELVSSFINSLKKESMVRHGGSEYVKKMFSGLFEAKCPLLMIASEMDLTAQEFLIYSSKMSQWKNKLHWGGFKLIKLPEADHTFSKINHLHQMAGICIEWLNDL